MINIENGGIFDGTVGWEGADTHFDTDDGEVTLVKVTLFAGRNVEVDGKLPDDGLAHGHRILCRTSGPLHDVPPKGAAVHVSMPAGRWRDIGAGIIHAWATPSKLYADETQFIRVDREKGSITLFTTDDGTPNGKSVFARVKRTEGGGFEISMPHGRLTYDGRGFHVSHSSGASIDMGPIGGMPTPLDALAAILSLTCPGVVKLEAAAIALGTSTGVQEPVAKATTLQTLLGLITDYVGKLEANLAAIIALLTASPPGTPLATVPLVTFGATYPAEQAAALALASGVTAAATTLPSTATSTT